MKKAWLMVIIAILTSITCAISFLKIPPTMVLIMQGFGVSLTVVGLTMTVATIAQVIVTLPFGVVVAKIGPKKTMYIVLAMGFIGSAIGALSTNYTMLLVGRIFDGACFGVASIVVPPIISMWFPPQKRGLPMGIFSVWVALSMLIIFNVANPIAALFTWRGVWWFSCILTVILGIVFAFILKYPKEGEGSGESSAQAEQESKPSLSAGFKSGAVWNVAISFFFFTLLFSIFNNFYSTYLVQGAGLDLGAANKIYVFAIIGMAIGGIFSGAILNKVNRKYHAVLLTVSFVLVAICAFFEFRITSPSALIPFLLIAGFIYMLSVPIVFTLGSSLAKRPEEVGPIMAVVNFANGAAGVVSPLIVGPMVAAFGGWSGLSLPLLAFVVLAIIGCLLLQKTYAKRFKAAE
ncbi:MFS transporter [Dehalobacter sp. DCM]|uniref:MFS transporter n=1 Tax=Dehalobacter sp. DCM TaxID=2907827 RepID=UPI003081AC2A|nr:MFS transporter [Dehalobacter sp. DCM]